MIYRCLIDHLSLLLYDFLQPSVRSCLSMTLQVSVVQTLQNAQCTVSLYATGSTSGGSDSRVKPQALQGGANRVLRMAS